MGEQLREAHDRPEGDDQEHEARRRLPPRRRRGVLVRVGVVVGRQEVVAVPDGLDEHEDAPERRRNDGGEHGLAAAVCADFGRDREVGEHEGDDREHDQRRETASRPVDAERLLAVGEPSDERAQADNAGGDDHHGGIDGIPWQGFGR